MWIKQALVIMPTLLLVFMAQSVFWVPGVQSAANAESRLNRLVWYTGTTPEDMNPFQSTSASDGEISAHLGEGLLRYNEQYEIEPRQAVHAAVHHEAYLLVPASIEQEALEEATRARYGDAVHEIKIVEDWKPKTGDDAKAWESVRNDSALTAMVEVVAGLRQVKITLKALPRAGEITSAVEPFIVRHLDEELGKKLHAAIDVKELVKNLSEPEIAGLAKTLEAEPGKLAEKLEEAMTAAGITAEVHNPVVEFEIKKGNYWTDGPFFERPERVWMVLVDGEEAGYFRADTEQAVIAQVRRRMNLGEDVNLTTWQFTETFRPSDEPDGPWWGKGPELTSRDVKLTLDLLRNRDFASPRMSSWLDVSEVRTDDDNPYRLEVVYRRLYSPAVGQLTAGALPYHHWNKTAWTAEAINKGRGPADIGVDPANFNHMTALHPKLRDYSRKPASIGPMVLYPYNGDVLPLWENGKIVRLLRNQFYTLDRQPAYEWIDYYIFNPQMGAETSEMVFNTGGIDLYGCAPHQVRRYEQQGDRFTIIKRQTTTYAYIGFNLDREPVNDINVRRALAMALNVDDVIEYIVWGQGERVSGPGYPVLPWYDHDYSFEYTWLAGEKKGQTEQLSFVPYHLAEARALLEKAGYSYATGVPVKDGRPLELTITMHTGNPIRRDIAVLAQQEWGKLGIKVEMIEHEWNVYLAQYIRPRNFTVCVLGWSGGLDFDKRQLWHGDFLPPTGLNFSGFKNEEADRVMDDILKEYDFEKQVEMSHRMFKLIADELPYIFLYSGWTTTIVDPRIGWRRNEGDENLRPLRHQDIANARAPFGYWMYELERMREVPKWQEADFRD